MSRFGLTGSALSRRDPSATQSWSRLNSVSVSTYPPRNEIERANENTMSSMVAKNMTKQHFGKEERTRVRLRGVLWANE